MLTREYISRGSEVLGYRLDTVAHDAVEEMLHQYSPTGGPVRKVITYNGCSPMMPVSVGHCEYYDFDYILQRLSGLSSLDTGVQKTLFAGGKGPDLFSMFVSSLGETVERVLGGLYFFERATEGHRFGSYRQLTSSGLRCLGPDEMPLFAPEQYADPDCLFEPYREDSLLGWIEGERLRSGEKIWVPSQLVELVYTLDPEESVIGYSASGGLASHISWKEALFHGITELIERDAANVRWYAGIAPERIVFDRPFRNRRLQRLFDQTMSVPGEMGFYLHSVDIPEVPVITAIKIEQWLRRASYNAGGGGDVDIDTAIHKSLNEYGQSERTMMLSIMAPERIFARGVTRMFDMHPDDPISKIEVFFQIISYYGYRQNNSKLDWYLQGNQQVNLSDLPAVTFPTLEDKFDYLMGVLDRHSLDPIVFDMTPTGMTNCRLVKVFIPELTQPFLQSKPILGHPRFAEAARLLGRGEHDLPVSALTSDPLPYP